MSALKSIFLSLFTGALVGVALASWLAPSYLAWNNTPGQGQALCDCVKVTRDVSSELIHFQLVGASAVALVFLFFGLLVLRVGRAPKSKVPTSLPPPATPR